MATKFLPSPNNDNAEEDYIDMEVSSSSNYLCYSINSPPQAREFEFQMSSAPNEKETAPCPADELFYEGKLLPLHLPPRLRMVQNLLQNPTKLAFPDEKNHTIPFITISTAPCTNNTTPVESCNISPSESCRVSTELNPDEYFFEWSTELGGFIADNIPKKSWSKKLKLIKQSLLGQKLKASKAYLKSIFSKSACSDESSAKAADGQDSNTKEIGFGKYIKVAKKSPFGQIGKGVYPTLATVLKSMDREMAENGVSGHRKSFSGAIKRHATKKSASSSTSSSGASSLSSSFSINSSGLQSLKRSSSANSELETSVEGAIAHCKQSQQLLSSSKTSSEVGLCSLPDSKIEASEVLMS